MQVLIIYTLFSGLSAALLRSSVAGQKTNESEDQGDIST